ncbi:MAG: S8 family serine peptidase [Pseudomonadota bacterium]
MTSLLPPPFKALILTLCLSLGLTACETFVLEPPSMDAVQADADDVVDPSVIVVLADTRSEAEALVSGALARGYTHQQTDVLTGLGLYQVVLGIPSGRTGAVAIAELETLQRGVTAGVNHAYRPQGQAPGRHYAKAAMSWPTEKCVLQQPIGVVDGGFGTSQSTRTYQRFINGPQIEGQHGAEITAQLEAVAGSDQHAVYHADVLQASSNGNVAGVDAILRAVSWLVENNVYVINISLAGPYNKILDRGLQRAHDRGALLIAAAGNDGPTSAPRYPAALQDVIAVTAVDASLDLYRQAVRGSHIDVAAPGVDIFIDVDGGTYRTGTSHASPYVAAYFAARSTDAPNARAARQLLSNTSADLGAPGHDGLFGWGVLQADLSCS